MKRTRRQQQEPQVDPRLQQIQMLAGLQGLMPDMGKSLSFLESMSGMEARDKEVQQRQAELGLRQQEFAQRSKMDPLVLEQMQLANEAARGKMPGEIKAANIQPDIMSANLNLAQLGGKREAQTIEQQGQMNPFIIDQLKLQNDLSRGTMPGQIAMSQLQPKVGQANLDLSNFNLNESKQLLPYKVSEAAAQGPQRQFLNDLATKESTRQDTATGIQLNMLPDQLAHLRADTQGQTQKNDVYKIMGMPDAAMETALKGAQIHHLMSDPMETYRQMLAAKDGTTPGQTNTHQTDDYETTLLREMNDPNAPPQKVAALAQLLADHKAGKPPMATSEKAFGLLAKPQGSIQQTIGFPWWGGGF